MLNEFFRSSSFYILKRIGNSKTVTDRLFWFVIFIFGLIGCISQSVALLATYYSYPILINTESVKPNYLAFPAVTVCNLNNCRKQFQSCVKQKLSYQECLGMNETDESGVFHSYKSTLPDCKENEEYVIEYERYNSMRFDTILRRVFVSQSYTSRIKYGHQFEDLIKACTYNEQNCAEGNFKRFVSEMYGNCYTFNFRNQNLLSTVPGPANGLMLDLDIEVVKYFEFTDSVGAVAEIHNPLSESSIDKKGIFLRPGYETHIAITQSAMSRLPSPYKDHCRKYKLGDSREKCRDLCFHKVATSTCSCTVELYLGNSEFPRCDLTHNLTLCCLIMMDTKIEKNSCDCPISCEDIVYNLKISPYPWPTKAHYKEMQKLSTTSNGSSIPLPLHKFRENSLRLRVYFDTFDFTLYKQYAVYQSSEIFSQVGGNMGLWLGLSIIFIFECLEKIITICRRLLKYQK